MASTAASASLAAASSLGAGTTVDFARAVGRVTAVISVSVALTGGMVTIEASQDDTNWVTLRSIGVAGRDNYSVSVQGVAFRYWRARIVTAVTGGTVRVTFMEADTDAGTP